MRKAMVGGLALAAAVGTAPGLMAGVKGTLAIRGVAFTVADAVAYKADDGIEVAFLPAALDRKEAAKDRKIDTFDLMHGDGRYVALIVGADGSFNCINYSTGKVGVQQRLHGGAHPHDPHGRPRGRAVTPQGRGRHRRRDVRREGGIDPGASGHPAADRWRRARPARRSRCSR